MRGKDFKMQGEQNIPFRRFQFFLLQMKDKGNKCGWNQFCESKKANDIGLHSCAG